MSVRRKTWSSGFTKVAITCAVIFLVPYVMPVSGKCKTAEVEMCLSTNPPKGCFCEPCISCEAGYGPSHPCGGQYPNGTVISCKPCMHGKNYSEKFSVASCQPCPQCGGKKTLRKCRPKRKTRCSTECRAGYIMSILVDDCILNPAFKTSPKQIDTSKLTTTPDLPKSTAIPKTTANTTTLLQVGEAQATMEPFRPDTSGIDEESNSKGSEHSWNNTIILTVICSIMLIGIVVVAVYTLYKRRLRPYNQDASSDNDEKMALTHIESPRTSQEDIVPWKSSVRIKDIQDNLRSDIATLISKESLVKKNWRAIGERLGLSSTTLDSIEVAGDKKNTTPGLQLFTVLETGQQVELTLTEFVKTLEKLERFIQTMFLQKQ